jgi:hypothetical protein
MPFMRRRPLLRAAAVSAGTHYVDKRRMEKERGEAGAYAPAPAAPPPAAPAPAPAPSNPLEDLERLGKLREQGILTDEEFAQQKAKILAAT